MCSLGKQVESTYTLHHITLLNLARIRVFSVFRVRDDALLAALCALLKYHTYITSLCMHVTADVDDGAGAEGYKLVNEVFVAAFARRVDYNCSFV